MYHEIHRSRDHTRDASLADRVEASVPSARTAHHGCPTRGTAERAGFFAAGDHGSRRRRAGKTGHCCISAGLGGCKREGFVAVGSSHSFTNETPHASAVYLDTYYPSAVGFHKVPEALPTAHATRQEGKVLTANSFCQAVSFCSSVMVNAVWIASAVDWRSPVSSALSSFKTRHD